MKEVKEEFGNKDDVGLSSSDEDMNNYSTQGDPCKNHEEKGKGLENGQILGGFGIPMELLEKILALLQLEEVLNASKVCGVWKDIIRSPVFWSGYYKRNQVRNSTWTKVHEHVQGRPDEWAVHYSVVRHDMFNRNLLVNPFGVDGFEGWKIVSGTHRYNGGNGWQVVTYPEAKIKGFPQGLGPSICFATDAFSCSKEQTIDLWKVGFTPAVIRACIPFTIKWGAYVGTPPNHGAFHEMHVRLLDKTGEDLSCSINPALFHSVTIKTGSPFVKYGSSFKAHGLDAYEYIDKLRFVYFYHGGMAKDSDIGYNGAHIYCPMISIELGTNPISSSEVNVSSS